MSVWACELTRLTNRLLYTDNTVTVQRSANLAEIWTREKSVPTNALSPDVYRIRRLEQGDAKLTSETVGKYLPQDLNYDINGRVDFNKGCYTGQEIIARLHFRGEPKRRLRLLSLASYEDITPVEKVLNAEGKPIGSVIEAVASGVAPCAFARWLLMSIIKRRTSWARQRWQATVSSSNFQANLQAFGHEPVTTRLFG